MGNENIYGEQEDSLSVINDYAQELLKVCDKPVQIQLIELIISTCSSTLSRSPSLSPSPLSSSSPICSPSSIISSPSTLSPSPRCLLPEQSYSVFYSQNSPNGQSSSALIPQPVEKRELFNSTSPQIDLLLSRDWSKTSMGPVDTWCPQLRSLIDTIMMAEVAMMIMWGNELYSIYNKAHSYLMGGKDFTFGLPYKENWPEKWEFVAPIFKLAMPGGKGIIHHDHCLDAIQNGEVQECFFTWSQSPIFIHDGSVGGILVVCIETTPSVLGKRRAGILYSMSQKCQTSSVVDTVESVTKELSNHPKDIPFSLIYLKESDSTFRLKAMHGLPEDHFMAPKFVDLNAPQSESSWPFLQSLNSSEIVIVEVRRVFGEVIGSAWPESIKYASVQPIYTSYSQKPFGFVISAASPRNILDGDYKKFLQLVVLQISASITTSLSREQERLRADELAENDRLRTAFFHNVSHELRTPLMLMLGPLESVLAGPTLLPETRALFDLLYNNAHRLRRLVNNLLDFAKVEARVSKGHFSAVDISQITRNFACVFKEASIQAGLEFVMKLPSLEEQVYVDTDMWELVVSNLLSNALKFTKEGKIEIEVRKVNEHVEMLVSDTGVGILKENIEKLFSRFSDFKTDFNRTNEGTGIGLSLSRELIRIHGGNIEVSSEPGKGTIFTVRIPIGKDHLPIEQVSENPTSATKFLTDMQSKTTSPNYRNERKCININEMKDIEMKEVLNGNGAVHDNHQSPHTYPDVPRILLVDDNADMRVYISGLLKKQGWEVLLACDGEEAYQKATELLPDLVLSDVMMPKLNGFQLLSCLRENKATCHLPVILLSARGGEDAQLEGLKMGADDYLLKPCSEAQIVVRVNLHLELGRLRADLQREVDCRLRELDQVHANLRESEEQFRTLAALSPVGIVRFQNNRFCYYNDRWGEITGVKGVYGVTAEEWERVVHPLDRDRISQRWHEFLDKKVTTLSEEVRYKKPGGKITHALLEANYITEGTGQGYVLVVTDITEIKDLEQQRLEAVRKAEEEQRKRALDAEYHKQLQEQFVNTICHEIRNPLNGIYNNAQLLQSSISTRMDTLNKASCDDGTRKYLKDMILGDKDAIEAIFICAAHQKMITNDVLDTSKIESGSMTLSELPFDAARTITTTAKMFYTEMSSKGIELKTHLPESVPVCGDNNRLSQVMINLLSNSIKFTAKAPVKVITVSLVSQPISNDYVRLFISVADTGLGMTEEEQALIFDRFKQGNRDISINYGGHGLGLYICKNLVEMMHGNINVKSERNSGTTISFTIECKKSTDGGISNYNSLEPPAPSVPINSISIAKKRNILVVEDNPINQKVITRQLTKLGHACCIANNGKEAVDKLLPSNESNYDVVLMDIQMPVMDGLQATQIIRHQEKLLHLESIPIIGLSGNATKSQIDEAYDAGMMDFITKPYDIKDLLQKIENVLLK